MKICSHCFIVGLFACMCACLRAGFNVCLHVCCLLLLLFCSVFLCFLLCVCSISFLFVCLLLHLSLFLFVCDCCVCACVQCMFFFVVCMIVVCLLMCLLLCGSACLGNCLPVCMIVWFKTLQGDVYPVEEVPMAVCKAIANILQPMDAMPERIIVLQPIRELDTWALNKAMLAKYWPTVLNMDRINHKDVRLFFHDDAFMWSHQFQFVVCLFMLIENYVVFGSLPSHFRDNTNTKQSSARPNKITRVHNQAVETS